ncbi:TetR/AcrR family transcriptional regulator [Nocardioides sp.]|uniref:TetR/AcrR family transcriptional regulator n=1 Tax=Nocardioides sp. TaxID=35761 RepID=UPI002716CD80|nr:TetR/AcrR family transcriptional regulator [Nocardioides sp.]MDO9457196.1 TetR/AcrR family transcriptional regulator [Nocardioides sp.]
MASSPDSQVREHPAAAYHARRRSEVDAKILKTARDVLNNEGLAALTVERVAADSGVAKTTIYRRFKHRLDLATAAVAELPEVFDDTGSGVEIHEWLRNLVQGVSWTMQTRAAEVIGAGLMYRHDEEFNELYKERVVEARAAAIRPRLQQAIDEGEIRSDVDLEFILSLLAGVVVGSHLNGTYKDEAWIDSMMTLIWGAISPA